MKACSKLIGESAPAALIGTVLVDTNDAWITDGRRYLVEGSITLIPTPAISNSSPAPPRRGARTKTPDSRAAGRNPVLSMCRRTILGRSVNTHRSSARAKRASSPITTFCARIRHLTAEDSAAAVTGSPRRFEPSEGSVGIQTPPPFQATRRSPDPKPPTLDVHVQRP